VTDAVSGMTDDTSGVTDDASGMTDAASGVTDETSGMTDDTSGVTDDAIRMDLPTVSPNALSVGELMEGGKLFFKRLYLALGIGLLVVFQL